MTLIVKYFCLPYHIAISNVFKTLFVMLKREQNKTVHNEISFNYNKLLHISHIIQDETSGEAGINYCASEH